ncbi:MAG: hypothetical protein LIR46_12815 [Bacteroidota bacterium]|nr:hypothetical protein [Bacteroidota bacterium]
MAQKIFQEWYEKHTNDPDDTLIDEMLDNAYDGRKIRRSEGMDANAYWTIYDYHEHPVKLPEEADMPQPPKYHLHIRFADGSQAIDYPEIDIYGISIQLANLGVKYHLYPDPVPAYIDYQKEKETIKIYAVLKDKEETYYEFIQKEDPYYNEKEKRE